MLFYLEFAQRPDRYPVTQRQPLEHASGLRVITRLEFTSPHQGGISPELQAVIDACLVRWHVGAEYLLELGFDGESQKKQISGPSCRSSSAHNAQFFQA